MRPLNIAEHLARGTFRETRHGAALAAALQPPDTSGASKADRRYVVRDLEAAGRRFAGRLFDACEQWKPSDLALLREAGAVVDRLEALRRALSTAGGNVVTGARGAVRPHRIAAELRAETRTLTALLSALNIREAR